MSSFLESEPLYSIFSKSQSIFDIFFLFLNPIHKKAQSIREHRQIQVKSNAKVDEQKPLFMTDSREILVSIDKKYVGSLTNKKWINEKDIVQRHYLMHNKFLIPVYAWLRIKFH